MNYGFVIGDPTSDGTGIPGGVGGGADYDSHVIFWPPRSGFHPDF
jgi:hypothetical protein